MTRRAVPLWALTALLLMLAGTVAIGGGSATAATEKEWPLTEKAILFASDGMRPDLVDKYAAQGAMDTMADLMADGVKGQNGLLQGFPPNTGVGWATLATGAWPGEHGSTNNTFFRAGDAFQNSSSFAATGILQTDTIAQAAERAGKEVVALEWVAARSYAPALQGPVVDFRSFIGGRGIVLNFDIPENLASSFGVQYQQRELAAATGWTNVPTSFSPAKETFFTHASSQIPGGGVWDVYVFDSSNDSAVNYNRALVVNAASTKNGSAAVATLGKGDWADAKVTLASGTFAGRTAGFLMKLIDLSADAETFRLYFTSVQRANATYNALGAAGSTAFEETLNKDFPTSTAADFAPLEALIVDEDTYIEQGLKWKDAHWAYLEHIIEDLGVKPDLLLMGNPVTDEFQHQFLGLVTPTDMDGNANPYFDNVDGTGAADGRTAIREGYIRSAYEEADETLGLGRELMGGDATVVASSDHGFAPQWYAVNVPEILQAAGLQPTLQSGNCRFASAAVAATAQAKECHAGGTAQIYVNPALPAGVTYEAVRTKIIDAFTNLDDPNLPGEQKVVDAVLKKEQLRNIDGTDALHPNRSGDVIVVFRPPYQTDAATTGKTIAFSQFFGQHGYLPNLIDIEHNVNMHGSFIAAGPGIGKQGAVAGVRAIDVAPTLAFLLGIPGPQNARGKILYDLTAGQGRFKEITFLDISDYHGQLVPLTETADTVGPVFPIGGSAFLKTWFDEYRAEAGKDHFTVAAGDSVGATPPISAFFGDTPTIEIMNLMGFSADGLGNHNFDKGSAYLRNTLIPLAKFPYVSANVVTANGATPKEWSPSTTFNVEGGKLGLVGFTNEDAPTLVFPKAFDPFSVAARIPKVQAEVNALKKKGAKVIVVMGHDGATAGTLTAPTGPLVDLADGLEDVDVVIGDHTNFQVLATRPNGTLVVENLSKGVRFTRVRIVLDTSAGGVVYKTADFHRPWNIGVTPDAAIQARITDLNTQLQPILGTTIGTSQVQILRSDVCLRVDGRLCESLVGDVTTDAMRAKYASIGVEFAITNSGGLRDALTCSGTAGGAGLCPAFTPPPYQVTRGQVLAVLPFGNIVVTLQVNGAELKTMLENGVSLMPAANGRFPQVSGLCFTYNIEAAVGSRVTGAVRQAAGGTCTGAAIDLTAGSSYEIAENDFMASGGDGYPNFFSRAASQDIMDQVLADHVTANSPLNPAIQGRIKCVDPNPGVGNNCPAGSP